MKIVIVSLCISECLDGGGGGGLVFTIIKVLAYYSSH